MRGLRQWGSWLLLLGAAVLLCACGGVNPAGGSGVVVLDVGHFVGGEGAQSPGLVGGVRLGENAFWYRYCYDVKRVIERAGYRCYVCNRGYVPTQEPLASYARRARVVGLRHPDRNGARYPSRYFPDRVASGMVSADYAIYRRADAVVFLHHNSSGSGWGHPTRGVVLANRYNGRPLAQCIADALNRRVLNHGMPNGGQNCTVQVRYRDADRAAGWLNACDDAGIAAAVTEAAFLNNREHVAFLATESGARRFAEAVGQGVVDFLRSGRMRRHRRTDPFRADEGSFGAAPESRRLSVPGARLLLR